jgi:hypothetical protein
MTKRIIAILLIFISVTIIWFILGGVNLYRTTNVQSSLSKKVETLWGDTLIEKEPKFYMVSDKPETYEEKDDKNRVNIITKTREFEDPIYPVKSDVKAKIDLGYRNKGLKWFSTYNLNYKAVYYVKSSKNDIKKLRFYYSFPSKNSVFDDFKLQVNDKDVANLDFASNKENQADYNYQQNSSIVNNVPVNGDEVIKVQISYVTRGLDFWKYSFGKDVNQIKDFNLEITTNFKDIDFPDDCISSVIKEKQGEGYFLRWNYTNLLSGYSFGVKMPQKINPGEMATKITFFAPISLLFFFAFLFFISNIKKRNLHPMHYFFLAASFFSFHLFFSYTIDHFNIFVSFSLASVISLFLVGFYMNLIYGYKFTLYFVLIPQFIYLVIFTFSFFFEGFTGLTVTIASIITLFVLMKLTADINWEEAFKIKK